LTDICPSISPLFGCDNITIGVSIDYLLGEFPTSTFNYHKAFNSEVKKKIISQISSTPLAFHEFSHVSEIIGATRTDVLSSDYYGRELSPTQLIYHRFATSMFDTFYNLSKLENSYNRTIC
jgi:hypothetical protein